MRDVSVILDNHCEINIRNQETMEDNIVFEFNGIITLREFIACLFNEITFYGSPDTAKEEFEKLKESFDEAKASGKNSEHKLVSFFELQLEWLNKELQGALFEENYQWAENVRKEIERVKKRKNGLKPNTGKIDNIPK